jgi:hypothetical protein
LSKGFSVEVIPAEVSGARPAPAADLDVEIVNILIFSTAGLLLSLLFAASGLDPGFQAYF